MGAGAPFGLLNQSISSDEVAESVNQIVQAFNQEFQLGSHRWGKHHHRHQQQQLHQHVHSVSSSSSSHRDDSLNQSRHRSHSADEYQPDEERQRISRNPVSGIKRQWQCQFCHRLNEGDILICADCGSNKINVYIPIIDRQSSTSSSPALSRNSSRYEI